MEITRVTKTVHTDKGIDLGIPDIELPPSSILQLNNSLNYKNKEANRNVSIEDFNLDNENILNTSSAEEINTDFSTYDLSDEQVKKIARLCVQEQGTVEGAAAEASLMANLFEVNNNDDITEITNLLMESGVKATFFVDGLWLENNRSLAEILAEDGNELEILNYNGKYDELYFSSSLNTLNNVTNVKPKYCYAKYDQKEVLELCQKLELHTIIPTIQTGNYPYQEVKRKSRS